MDNFAASTSHGTVWCFLGRANVRFWPKADIRGRILGAKFGYLEVFRPLSVR